MLPKCSYKQRKSITESRYACLCHCKWTKILMVDILVINQSCGRLCQTQNLFLICLHLCHPHVSIKLNHRKSILNTPVCTQTETREKKQTSHESSVWMDFHFQHLGWNLWTYVEKKVCFMFIFSNKRRDVESGFLLMCSTFLITVSVCFQGCYEKVEEWLDDNKHLLGTIAMCVLVIQVSSTLCCIYPNSQTAQVYLFNSSFLSVFPASWYGFLYDALPTDPPSWEEVWSLRAFT